MALIDNVNKVIYWDEVNWQWLPFVSVAYVGKRAYASLRYKKYISCLYSGEEVVNFLTERGYILTSLSSLGIIELSLGCYLYKGRVFQSEGKALKNLSWFLSMVSGKSVQSFDERLKGKGVISKELLCKLISRKDTIKFKGKVYSSYSELSRDYGFDSHFVSTYLRKGFSLDEIMSKKYDKRRVIDHLGSEYKTTTEMVSHWGIARGTYERRIRSGWSLEEALTGKRG